MGLERDVFGVTLLNVLLFVSLTLNAPRSTFAGGSSTLHSTALAETYAQLVSGCDQAG